MKKAPVIDISKTIRSFGYAVAGVFVLFRSENNARIHLISAVSVIILAWFLKFSAVEWAVLLILIGIVWIAEAFNTSLEKLADLVSPEYHPLVKASKDLAAGGVLIASILALIAGSCLIIPKLWLLIRG